MRDKARRFRQFLSFQARFQPGLGLHQLRAQFFHQVTIGFLSAFRTCQLAQLVGTLNHRQLGNQQLDIFQEQIGCLPAAEQQDVAGNIGSHVRVAVAVAAHPGRKANRNKVDRQPIVQVVFQLFIQLAQVVRYAFPQAIFDNREAPFGFIHRGRAMFADFIGVPRLGNQLAQTAHDLMTFIVRNVVVIELLQAAVDLAHLVDQRTTRDFGWVRGQHQLQRQGFNGLFNNGFVEIGLLFELSQGAGNHFRITGRFAFWRNAVVLLSGIRQIQKLAKGARHRQQLVVGQVLQRGEQLLAVGFIASARRFGQLTDSFDTIKNVFSQRILDGVAQHLTEHTDITTQSGILFVHVTPDTPSHFILLYPALDNLSSG